MKRIDITAGRMKTLSIVDVTARAPVSHDQDEVMTDVPEGPGKLVERRVKKTKSTKPVETEDADKAE